MIWFGESTVGMRTHDITADDVLAADATKESHHLIDAEPFDARLDVGHPGGDHRIETVEVERDVERAIADRFVDDLHYLLGSHGVVVGLLDDRVAEVVGRVEPFQTSGVAAIPTCTECWGST